MEETTVLIDTLEVNADVELVRLARVNEVPSAPAAEPNAHEAQQPDIIIGSAANDHKAEAEETRAHGYRITAAETALFSAEADVMGVAAAKARLDGRRVIERLARDLAEALASAQAELDLRKTTEDQLNAEIRRRQSSEQTLNTLQAKNVRLQRELDSVREELGDYASRILNLEHELNTERALVGAKTHGLNLDEQTDAVRLLQQYQQLLNALVSTPRVSVHLGSRNELNSVLRAATEKGFAS